MGSFVTLYVIIAFVKSESYMTFVNDAIIYFFGGIIFMWTFTEYFVHRFVLHKELNVDPNDETDPEKNAEYFAWHIHHHVFMN